MSSHYEFFPDTEQIATEIPNNHRYEKHIPALLGEAVLRSTSIWRWRDSDVHVEHIGNPDAPVRMLLVHGAGGNSAAMWPYAAHLSKLGAHVTVPDLPGYGETTTAHPEQYATRTGSSFWAILSASKMTNALLSLWEQAWGGYACLRCGCGNRISVSF